MTHKTKVFVFIDKDGNKVELSSKQFTFKTEKIVKEMVGKDSYQNIQKDKEASIDLTLDQVKEFYPQLLEGNTENIEWEDQDFDEVLSVTSFFLTFKKNAELRQLQFSNETIALAIEQSQKVLGLMQEVTSTRKS